MTCSVEYDLATGQILSVITPALPDSQPMPEGRGKLFSDENVSLQGKMVDLLTATLVDAPPEPPPPPDMLTYIFAGLVKAGYIDPVEVHPELLTAVNDSLSAAGISKIAVKGTSTPEG